MYKVEAATNAGATPEKARKRCAEVHQAALHIVLEAIRELCAPSQYRFANGEVYTGEVRLAFFMGDQVAHDKLFGRRSKGCRMCYAPHDQLADTNEIWPLFDWRACHRSLQRHALSCLDDDGKVIYGKGKVIAKWEQKHGMHFMYNSVFEFADEIGLDPVIGMPRDFLHWIILGLFGYHIVKAIIFLISKTILADAYLTEHGNRRAPVNQQTMHHVLQRLARRLASIEADESCLTITPEFAQHFLKVYELGKSSFTGPRMTYLILVLPYVMTDLVGAERRAINAAIDKAQADPADPLHGLPHVEDPCEEIIDALLVFLSWFLLVRRKDLPASEVCSVTARGIALMEKLKEVFPEKSGEQAGWNFRKFHDILHASVIIMFFGWLENTSCQSGELAHKILLKALAGNVNNYNVFIQFLRYWERYEQLVRAERENDEAGGADAHDAEEMSCAPEDSARAEAMHACELGTRCPLFFMALHRSSLHHTAASTGGVRGSSIKGKQAFDLFKLPADAVAEHPPLKALPLELSKFAYTYLKKSLALPPPADARGRPTVEELNAVLLKHLVRERGLDIKTWSTLELESDLCVGVQRIRCFPFRSDKAWKCNPMNYVAVIPPSKYTDIRFAEFDLADASHRRKLWFGRVELFFQCSFRNASGRNFQLDLALISCLYDFKCPDAQTILQREGGARMFYVPDTPWLIVLPINHILGRVPLMKTFLCGSSAPTIPYKFSRLKLAYFKHGHADRNGREGSGSPLFMLNVHLWQFGRPQARTISVQQRRANMERAQKATRQKRAQRMPYTKEKAARRRAMRAAAQ